MRRQKDSELIGSKHSLNFCMSAISIYYCHSQILQLCHIFEGLTLFNISVEGVTPRTF